MQFSVAFGEACDSKRRQRKKLINNYVWMYLQFTRFLLDALHIFTPEPQLRTALQLKPYFYLEEV